jgi:hypothetical protein
VCVGGNSASTDRKAELTGFGDLSSVFNTLSGFGKDLMSTGKGLVGGGGDLLKSGVGSEDKALKYFGDIMGGNPTAVLSAAAPSINAVTGQLDQAKKSATMNGNRSGGTNAQNQDASTKAAGTIADTLSKARSGAAGEVASIGGAKAGQGLQEVGAGLGSEGQAIGAEEGAGSAASNLSSIAAGSRKTSQDIHDAAVDQWANAISAVLFGA